MMREDVRLLIEQAHPDGTVTSGWKTYTIKVDYNAWIKATRTNLPERGQEIVLIEREGKITWRRDPEPLSEDKPRSTPLC